MLKRNVILALLLFCSILSFAQNMGNNDGDYFKNVSYYKKHNYGHNMYILNSNYNYINVANTITEGCSTNYEKICAIYKWICDNIEYDISYSIYDADNCFDNRRGVCQAYCNLFYHIAKSIGIETEIVSGKAKNYNGKSRDNGHSWIFAYIDSDYGILLDPTWGAGSVGDDGFSKSADCWVWFNVDPKWMILSHFPDDESYQLLDDPISIEKFYSMPSVTSAWIEYGLDPIEIYDKAMTNTLSLPTFFGNGEGRFKIIDMPMQKSLKIGQFYTFRIKMLENSDFAIFNEDIFCRSDEWNYEGNNVYSIDFMPRETGNLSFDLHDRYQDHWNCLIQYEIEHPTRNDWNNVRNHYPLDNPEIKGVKNLYNKEWNNAGINDRQLAKLIIDNNIRELPLIYTNMGDKLHIVSVPMNMKLKEGSQYTFSFYPQEGINWTIVNNDNWYKNWNISNDGKYSMTITPECGDVVLFVQYNKGESYQGCIKYRCE